MYGLANSRRQPRAAALIAAVVLVSSLFALLIQNGTPGFGPVRSVAASALVPFMKAGDAVDSTATSVWTGFFGNREIQQENEALRAELAQMRAERAAASSRVLEFSDAETFSEALPAYSPQTKTARVLAPVQDGAQRRLWINLGRYDGIEEGLTVLSEKGILGRVREVHGGHSIVQLLTDADSRWGGTVSQKVGEDGILEGTGDPDRLILRLEKTTTEISPGDEVLSTGFRGSATPGGLPLGVIERIDVNEAGEREAQVRIGQRGETLRHVFVLNSRQIGWEPPQ